MRILYVTTISLTMNTFFKPHIEMLVQNGNQVDIACNYMELPLDSLYKILCGKIYQIDFSRKPLSISNMKAYKQLEKVVENGDYDIVHCHTPNAAVITRLVCRKFRKENGLKVFYTAHGFHFYKGASVLNWLVFYPIEKLCSRFTDKLITINKEDYELAKKKFEAKEVHYVPGVGIDLAKFQDIQVDRYAKRREIGVPENAFLLLSAGELNENKNHQIVIQAMTRLRNPNLHYAIAGVGVQKEYLLNLSKKLGVAEQVHLLGYRKDIPELNYISDVFVFPSYREGLGLAAIEAMACGLPLITSNVHGINDYSQNSVSGYKCSPTDVSGFAEAIKMLIDNIDSKRQMGIHNIKSAQKYDITQILPMMIDLYSPKEM